jgi:hypothetical protein
VVVAAQAMSAAKQQRLIDFLKNGGKLVILPGLPELDEALRPCRLLADFLGAGEGHKNPAYVARNTILDVVNIQGSSTVFDQLPLGAVRSGQDEFSGKTIGWELPINPDGKVVVAGITWIHSMHEHTRLLNALLERAGIQRKVTCSNPYVWTALWRSGDKEVLYAANLFTQPMEAEFTTAAAGQPGRRVLGPHVLAPFSVMMIDPLSGLEWKD